MNPVTQLSLDEARDAVTDHTKIAELIGVPVTKWAGNCHAISLKVLRTGIVGPGRMARGWASQIRGQHSWIVLGNDCYDPDAVIVDPTYRPAVAGQDVDPVILVEHAWKLNHRPHGSGSIFDASYAPEAGDGPKIELTPAHPLSARAAAFLKMVGPLDRQGWFQLAHAPVGGWPASEILAAITDTQELASAVPIDILGMITDRNPGGLYR